MYRYLFRVVVGLALVAWLAMVVSFIVLRMEYTERLEQIQAAANVPPLPTSIPVPTIAPATLEPLPDSVGQGGAELPGTQSPASVHPKTGRYVAAWLPTSFDAEAARATFEANKDILDEVSPFWYGIYRDGRLVADIGSRDMELVRIARENNVLVIPTIHNIEDAEAASILISDPALRTKHIAIIVEEVMAYEYDGIDIDYEGLTSDMTDEYTAFIAELSAALHAKDKLLTIAVHAHNQKVGFHDYEALGPLVDRLRIMTYDYSWRGSGAGPIAPLYWVRSVAEYASKLVDPAKIEIGICFYAYDWGASGPANSLTWTDVNQIIADYQPRVSLVEQDSQGPVQESTFNYAGRTVWFSNYRSLTAKLDMVREMDLAGIAIWRLGNEDPKNWEYIRSSLKQDPVIIQRTLNGYIPDK